MHYNIVVFGKITVCFSYVTFASFKAGNERFLQMDNNFREKETSVRRFLSYLLQKLQVASRVRHIGTEWIVSSLKQLNFPLRK